MFTIDNNDEMTSSDNYRARHVYHDLKRNKSKDKTSEKWGYPLKQSMLTMEQIQVQNTKMYV